MRSRTKSMVVRFKQFSHEYSEAEEICIYKFHVDTTWRCGDAIILWHHHAAAMHACSPLKIRRFVQLQDCRAGLGASGADLLLPRVQLAVHAVLGGEPPRRGRHVRLAAGRNDAVGARLRHIEGESLQPGHPVRHLRLGEGDSLTTRTPTVLHYERYGL